MRDKYPLIALAVCFGYGTWMLGTGLLRFFIAYTRKWGTAAGDICSNDSKRRFLSFRSWYRPVVEFEANDGKLYYCHAKNWAWWPSSVGAKRTVRYDPSDPMNSFMLTDNWYTILLGAALYAVLISMTLAK